MWCDDDGIGLKQGEIGEGSMLIIGAMGARPEPDNE